ncbi:hypothetical protein NKH71_26670 [Mesorhizobium sp. M0983]|uniref:hypothetical protein n=1 Tax=Mesorhizobium sp. M0983 TaxID=2957040 RepID=UPI00333B708A
MRSSICLKSGRISVSSRDEDITISADDLADKLVEIGVPERQPPAVCAGLHSASNRSGRPVGPGWKYVLDRLQPASRTRQPGDQSGKFHFQSLEGAYGIEAHGVTVGKAEDQADAGR